MVDGRLFSWRTLDMIYSSSHHLGINYYVNFFFGGGGLGSKEFQLKWRFGTHGYWKNLNPGGFFGATLRSLLNKQLA